GRGSRSSCPPLLGSGRNVLQARSSPPGRSMPGRGAGPPRERDGPAPWSPGRSGLFGELPCGGPALEVVEHVVADLFTAVGEDVVTATGGERDIEPGRPVVGLEHPRPVARRSDTVGPDRPDEGGPPLADDEPRRGRGLWPTLGDLDVRGVTLRLHGVCHLAQGGHDDRGELL